jgi:sodium/bile acid cotransporter 7
MSHPNGQNRVHPTSAAILVAFLMLVAGLACPSRSVAEPPSDNEKFQRVMAMYADYRRDFAGIEEIGAAEALQRVGDPSVVFVDVREPEEQAVSMIPGAVTSAVYLADPGRFGGQHIIAYCTISYRSGKLAAKMQRKGITIVNLKGGLLAWVHAGGPLVRGNRPVEDLHVYGRKWDLAPQVIQTVY